jgi:hypothetical protein
MSGKNFYGLITWNRRGLCSIQAACTFLSIKRTLSADRFLFYDFDPSDFVDNSTYLRWRCSDDGDGLMWQKSARESYHITEIFTRLSSEFSSDWLVSKTSFKSRRFFLFCFLYDARKFPYRDFVTSKKHETEIWRYFYKSKLPPSDRFFFS